MSLYNAPNMTEGIDEVIVTIASEVYVFIPMFLLFVFAVVFIGGMSSQKRRTGSADTPMWAVLSSLATLMIALALTLVTGGIQLEVLGIVVAITIASGIWFFLDKNKNEI